jgi:ferrous iron transport protein B
LLISAFIPKRSLMFGIEQQGLVLFGLYVAGIVGAMTVAWLLKRFTSEGRNHRPLLMELPMYHWPTFRNIGIGLLQRVVIFLKRVGGVIFALTIVLWFLASFPNGGGIENSYAGLLGRGLAVIFEPIGFNWQICVALVPGMAAREVVVSSLATVYALSATGDEAVLALSPLIASQWSLPTAFSLLAWFVFAPQCFSTLAVVRRETGGYLMPVAMAAYLFGLAYIAAFITYKIAFAVML